MHSDNGATETSHASLRVEGIWKSYPGVTALRNVSFAVGAGEVVALLGHNGAGKSTLSRIIAGVEQPDEGQLLVGGVSTRLHSVHDAALHGIGLVPQELLVVPNLTVRENLLLGHGRRRFGNAPSDSRLREVIDGIGARLALSATAERLSPSSTRMLMVARSLIREPKILLLDEPTSSLPEPEVDHVLSLVRRLSSAGVGVVYVSHRLEEILEVAHRVVVLREGQLVADRSALGMSRDGVAELIVGHARDQQASYGNATVGESRPGSTEVHDRSPVLSCRSLACGGRVRDVTVGIHSGEVLGLTGLVGSGRTTLLSVLAGVQKADGGEICVDGEPVRGWSSLKATHAGITYLPEHRARNGLVPDMTVAENVTLGNLAPYCHRYLPLLRAGLELESVRNAMSRLDLRPAGSERRKLRLLSGGNQQKVLLARGLARRARIFLFDEPTEGIDVEARDQIHALIRELASDGAAVLVSSADIEEVTLLSDRIVVLGKGMVAGVLEGPDISIGQVRHVALA